MKGMAAETKETKYIIHPAKFSLWLFIVSIILFFGGITSAYIVSKGIESDKDMWYAFDMPPILWYTTGVLLISSIMLQFGVWGAKKGDFSRARISLILTFILGVFFLIGQIFAWTILRDSGVVFGNANSSNYMYLLTGLHGVHIIAGLIFVLVVLVNTFRGKYKQGNTIAIENCATFWHFLDLLWIYLFIFLLLNQG